MRLRVQLEGQGFDLAGGIAMSHPLGDATWIPRASSGLTLGPGNAELRGRCHVKPSRRLKPMRAELDESAQSAQRRPWDRGAVIETPARHILDCFCCESGSSKQDPLRWRLCHSHADCPQLAAGRLYQARTPTERSRAQRLDVGMVTWKG